MQLPEYYQAFAERLHQSASVQTIYGDPIEAGEKTIIPVARVAYAFGGGPAKGGNPDGVVEATGGGGAVSATPLGVFEITPEGTRFVSAGRWKKPAAWLLVGLGLGYALGRLSASSR